jgi:peptidoglycan/LPS O-acetylase OafA/YrhL
MTGPLSLYLDALRVGAALVVVLSHLAYSRYSGGLLAPIEAMGLGADAVIVFFVLSGFVVAHAAAEKDTGLNAFLFSRATRILSVAVPALLVGHTLDTLGARLSPVAYEGWWYAPLPLWEVLLRGLTFSNEWGGLQARLGTNGPYWSLSYEVAYYLLFGAAFYLRGWRRVALIAVGAAIVGINILLLALPWLMGVAIYRALAGGLHLGRSSALLAALLPLVILVVAQSAGFPGSCRRLTEAVLGAESFSALRFSGGFLWGWCLAALVSVHLLGMACLLRVPVGRQSGRMPDAIRWAAGASFSIYLMHYPALHFIDALLPGEAAAPLRIVTLLIATLVACLAFAAAFERTLPQVRAALRRLAPRGTAHRA